MKMKKHSKLAIQVITVVPNLETEGVRKLLEKSERDLQSGDPCQEAIEATLLEILVFDAQSTINGVAGLSITSSIADGSGGLTITTDVTVDSTACASDAAAEVDARLQAAIGAEFDTALQNNLVGRDCDALANVSIVSASAAVCTETSNCNGLSDTTSCGAGKSLRHVLPPLYASMAPSLTYDTF